MDYYKRPEYFHGDIHNYMNQYGRMPFYMTYPAWETQKEEMEMERDLEYMKQMYSKTAKEIQEQVEAACDAMEYDGSMMFDEYPDKLMLQRICDSIYEKTKHLEMPEEMPIRENADEADDIFATQCTNCQPNPWLRDMIQVMLFQEMHKRRCRRRRCNRWW